VAVTPSLFLSCVREEFEQHRLRLANQMGALPGMPYRIVVQEDFRQGTGSLLEWLDEQIMGCDLVIHLAGELGGQVVTSAEHVGRLYARWGEKVPTPLPTYTYTQWEYWLARRYGKPILVYSLALPKDHVFADAFQAAHWAAVRASGEHRKSFADAFELVREVYHDLGLRPDHASTAKIQTTKKKASINVLASTRSKLPSCSATPMWCWQWPTRRRLAALAAPSKRCARRWRVAGDLHQHGRCVNRSH
jgi:hypothetical protein